MNFTKYDKFGAYHWNEYEQGHSYGQHADHVANWVQSGVIMDIGAGDGLITHLLNKREGSTCIGIDNNRTAIRLAKEKGAPVIFGSVYDLKGFEQVDAIYFGDVVEHLEEPRKALQQIKQLLKPEGTLYLVTPPARADGVIEDPHHYFEWTPVEMELFLHEEGFKMQSITVKPEWRRMYAAFKLVE